MSDIAIRVDSLSKLYPEPAATQSRRRLRPGRAGHLGAVHQRPDTLRDALTGFLPRITRIERKGKENSQNSPNTCTCVRRKCSRQASQVYSSNSLNSRQASGSPDDLWALKDVSFEVKRGEVTG